MKPQLFLYDPPDGVVAFSTTRHGGVSKGNYASLNINGYCGDAKEDVAENRHLLCMSLNLSDESHLVIPHQTHGTTVLTVDKTFLSLDEEQRQQRLEGIDAVITNVPQVCIGVSTADCIPIIIYDAVHHAAAAIHAGWRGTVARIVKKAVAALQAAYGSQPAELQAWIGPGISLKNFEVGQEVYDQFAEAGFQMERIAMKYEKWHIDLPMCNRMQLEEAGVPLQSIRQMAVCTYDQTDDYFSARRLGINSGRIYTGVILQ
jgi:YfiH family protein